MNCVLLVVLAFVACAFAQGQQVCLPQAFSFQRSSHFNGFNGTFVGFDMNQEYYDYNGKRFRSTTQAFENGTQIFFDLIILAGQNTLYQIYTRQGSGEINCTKNTGTFSIPPACLLSNATNGGYFSVAGDVATVAWQEQGWDNRHHASFFEEIGLTYQTNIPIQRRRFVAGNPPLSESDLYFNYQPSFPSNAFDIPSFCPSSERTYNVHETREMMQHYFGAFPRNF